MRPLGLPLISRDQTFEVHALRNAVLLLLLVALVAVACVRFVRPRLSQDDGRCTRSSS